MDLTRKILLAIEDSPTVRRPVKTELDNYDPEQISYHVMLLTKANLIEAHDISTRQAFRWNPVRLTWEGHEFLDATRDETRWKKVKKIVSEKGGSLPFDVIKALAVQLACEAVGLG